jgi:hypothetical protein
MAYVTVDCYRAYNGASYESADEGELEAVLERATEVVDALTGGRLTGGRGVEWLPPAVSDRLARAVCAEAAFIERNGGLSSLDSSQPVQMSLGRFSYMHASGTVERKAFPISPLAEAELEAAGLLCRVIGRA